MILTKNQVKILNVFKKDLFEEFSLSKIKNELGKISRAWLYRFLEELVKNKILLSKSVSKTKVYKLNLENINTLNYLSYCDVVKLSKSKIANVINMIINKTELNYCLIVFGSYAENKQSKNSDLDLCFLIFKKTDEKKLKPIIENIKIKSLVKIDEHYITMSEFKKMLNWEKENLGKEIYRNNLIVFNHAMYYNLINKMENKLK